jgi:hypothetical protein
VRTYNDMLYTIVGAHFILGSCNQMKCEEENISTVD